MPNPSKSKREDELAKQILGEAEVGYLSIILKNGFPRVVPLDFVYWNGKVYFHGATEGEKHDVLAQTPKVSFCAVVPLSSMPSYWLAKDYACPANHLFKSVVIYGIGSVVKDKTEKANALQKLMERHQPEGKFRKISADDPYYDKHIKRTAIFRIDPQRITVKVKVGEVYSEKVRKRLIAKFEERDQGTDRTTAEEIKKTL